MKDLDALRRLLHFVLLTAEPFVQPQMEIQAQRKVFFGSFLRNQLTL